MSRKPETLRAAQHQAIGCCWKGYGDNMKEIWKDIAGYEGLYEVSNFGSVRSIDRYVPHKTFGKKFCKGHMMATHINNAGYVTVNLCKCNMYRSFDIHRLVAIAFLDNPYGLPEVNHIDENKKNNHVENLEWVTKSENNLYGTKRERHAAQIKRAVLQYSTDGQLINEWESPTDAEISISGKATGAISHCAKGKTKTAYGYVWRYKEAE